MATDNIVAGLFGTPEQYQQQQFQSILANRAAQANMTPEQQAQFALNVGIDRAAQGLGGLMGVEDPQMKVLSIRNQVGKEINWNDPQSLASASRQLLQAGDIQGSQQLAEKAQALQDKLLANMKTQSEVAKNMREQLTTDQRNFAQARDEGYRGSFNQWLNEQNASKGTKVAVNVPIGQVFDKFFTQKNAEEQAKTWNEYGQAYSTIPATIDKLNEARTLIDQSFTGRNADVKLGAAKLARSLGLPIDVNKASATELTEALTTQFAINELKKNFGSNPAVKDFENQLKVKPNILQEPETFKKLLDKLVIGLQSEQVAYRQGENYRKANKGSIDGYNPYVSRADAQTKLLRLTALMNKSKQGKITDTEKAEAVKLQGELNGGQ
jgi:hypothetical protein